MNQSDDTITLAQRLEANEIAAWRSMYQAPPPEVANSLGIGYAERDGTLQIWNRAAPVSLLNRVLGLGIFEPATDALLDELLARGLAVTSRLYVQLAPAARPDDLAARIAARRLRREPEWQVHSFPLNGALPVAPTPAGYRVEQVSEATVAAWADALLAGWGFPGWAAAGALALVLPLLTQPAWTCLAAVHVASGQVIGGGALFVADGVGGLYCDGVRPEHRQRGLHEALIVARLAAARQQGCGLACAQTLAGHTAEHNMVRAGFAVAYTRQNYMMPK
jgi:GNAT superfamily N-acetyltransferase